MNFFKSILDFFKKSTDNSKPSKKKSVNSKKKVLKKTTLNNIPDSPSKVTIDKEPKVSYKNIKVSSANNDIIALKINDDIDIDNKIKDNLESYLIDAQAILPENNRIILWAGSAQTVEFTINSKSVRTRLKADITKVEKCNNIYVLFGSVEGSESIIEFSSKKIVTKILVAEINKKLSMSEWVNWLCTLEQSSDAVSKNDSSILEEKTLHIDNKNTDNTGDEVINVIKASDDNTKSILDPTSDKYSRKSEIVEVENHENKKSLSPEIIDTINSILNADSIETKPKKEKHRVNEDNLETID